MLTNLPYQQLNSVTFRFGMVDAFFIQLFDQSGHTTYHRNRQIRARTIQRNWRLYCQRKNKPSPTLKLNFNHPIKEIFWALQQQSIKSTASFNYDRVG